MSYSPFGLGVEVNLSVAHIASGDWIEITSANRSSRLLIRVTEVEQVGDVQRIIKGSVIHASGETPLTTADPVSITLNVAIPQQGRLIKRSNNDYSDMAADEIRTLMAVEIRELLLKHPKNHLQASSIARRFDEMGLWDASKSWDAKKRHIYRIVDSHPTLFSRNQTWIKLLDNVGVVNHKAISPSDMKTPVIVDFPKFIEGAKLLMEAFGFVVRL